ncbi:MAG: nucleotide exchange factor GrpE [Bacteroidetes bacterium]|nr:nucleotide exchange factor GrpE [Bacteroidota bacterium]|tara:strand:- start:21 stop:596 length:576 start_codon:yes stop_codon:yes gene_type:complete
MAKKAVDKEEIKTEAQAEEKKAKKAEVKEEAPKRKKSKKTKKETELEELKIKHSELNDKHLRLFSEFDNFRKRTSKERLELTKTASADVILNLLPILDDFERAIKASGEDKEESMIEGVKLIYNKFKSILGGKGLEAMDCIGQEFDTDFHEAITKIPAPTKDDKGKIVDEIEKGYTLGGKVIRYAKVVVGS